MKQFASFPAVVCLLVALSPVPAAAQGTPAGFEWAWGQKVQKQTEKLDGKTEVTHWEIIGQAELWQGDTKFNADRVDFYEETHKMVAVGHVQLTQTDSLITADRMEFNTETQTGIFYNAWGMASISDRGDKVLFGGMEPDMFFEGRTVEKIGPKSYKVTKGRFTTCVQPVPRWQITSGTVVISLDHYAMLTHPIIRVKGVPVFYLPIIYYPVKKEDRATGFLLPSYGMSTLRGFTLSNAFFWAIGRSQDLTLMHDYFKRTGQGVGAEYRYVRTPSAQGNLQLYMLNERALLDPTGSQVVTPGRRSYEMRGEANETISRHLRAGGRVSYFTDLVAQQTYNTNIFDASRGQRTINGNMAGSWGVYSFTASYDRNEYFSDAENSAVSGSSPKINFSRAERPIGNLPIYVRVGGEYALLERGNRTANVSSVDSLSRIDFSPTVRVPFNKWPFLSVNSSLSWRGTFWSKSWDANHAILDQSVSRRLFELQTRVSGPTFNRIFDTSKSAYAEKLKHTVEPYMTVRYTTSVDRFNDIIQWEGIDAIVGPSTRISYGIDNRLYARRKRDGKAQAASEILDFDVSQTYYTEPLASQYDPQYGTAFTGIKPNHFSPVALTMRATPTDRLSTTLRAEIDSRYRMLRTLSAAGNFSAASWLTTSAGWNVTRFISEDGLSDPTRLSDFVNGSASFRFDNNHYGGNYSFNYDVHNGRMVQQRLTALYNAQCCGFAVEYQTFDFGSLPGRRVNRDNRFNFSFTLAGIGSFSNFFGAMGGAR